jgi:hypothetical protein
MSAETNSVVPAARRPGPALAPVLAVLADGTPAFAPIGEVVVVDGRVVCHLCGRALRSVTAHLRVHGYTKEAYCAAFGLERGQSLEGPDTRKLRAAALTSRLVFDVAFRTGSAAGRQRARAGELTRDAAAAATGRRYPEQRRRKARQALAGIPAEAVAQANAERARRHVARVADEVARQHGYPDLGAFVLARLAGGASLAAISREAGLHKDWLSRHLGAVAPAATAAVPRQRPPGRTPAGDPHCTGWGSPTCPVTSTSGTSGSTGRSTPWPPRSASPSTRSSPRCAVMAWTGSRTRPPGTRRMSAPLRSLPGWASTAWASTCASARRPGGRGGPWRPSPASLSHGCAARPPGPCLAEPGPAWLSPVLPG